MISQCRSDNEEYYEQQTQDIIRTTVPFEHVIRHSTSMSLKRKLTSQPSLYSYIQYNTLICNSCHTFPEENLIRKSTLVCFYFLGENKHSFRDN